MSEEKIRLDMVHLSYDNLGENRGGYSGEVVFKGGFGKVFLKLTPALSTKIMAAIGDELVSAARIQADVLHSSAIQAVLQATEAEKVNKLEERPPTQFGKGFDPVPADIGRRVREKSGIDDGKGGLLHRYGEIVGINEHLGECLVKWDRTDHAVTMKKTNLEWGF